MVRGRIDFARLARQGGSLDRVPSEVWERSDATSLNRFLVAALLRCVRDEAVRDACEPHLRRVVARTAAIEPAVDHQLLHGTRPLDRTEQPFASVVALARWLLLGHGLADGLDQRAAASS